MNGFTPTLPVSGTFGGYQLFSGTSAAGPHVAGAAALLLQLNPDCGPVVKYLIEATAYPDTYTGLLAPWPSPASIAWGYGKLNVSQALVEAAKLPIIWDVSESPSSPNYDDAVTITANISTANFVLIDFTFDDWLNTTIRNMTLSGGLYTFSMPAQRYGIEVEYRIFPVKPTAIGNPMHQGSYIIDDTIAPTFEAITNNGTSIVSPDTYVEVVAVVSDAVNASGMGQVVIEFTVDNWVSVNPVPMAFNGSHYVGYVPPGPAPPDLELKYRLAAYDLAGNRAQSSEYSYTISTNTATGFPLDTTTLIIIGAAAVVVILLLVCILKRKK
jgi:subtilisin family serine protease